MEIEIGMVRRGGGEVVCVDYWISIRIVCMYGVVVVFLLLPAFG